MHLWDAHCHLQDPRLGHDAAAALNRAQAAGVTDMVCCGTAEDDWDRVVALATDHPAVHPTLGLHPWEAARRSPDWLPRLRHLLVSSGASVGEVGLDAAIALPMDEQEEVLLAQLDLARTLRRPVSLHCRRAFDRLVPLLRDAGPLPAGFVVHAYSGGTEHLVPLLDLGARLSFSGTLCWTRNHRAHRACAAVPAERLLLETDAPDMAPPLDALPPDLRPPCPERRDDRDRVINEPARVLYPLHAAARLRAEEPERLAESTSAVARSLFLGREEPL